MPESSTISSEGSHIGGDASVRGDMSGRDHASRDRIGGDRIGRDRLGGDRNTVSVSMPDHADLVHERLERIERTVGDLEAAVWGDRRTNFRGTQRMLEELIARVNRIERDLHSMKVSMPVSVPVIERWLLWAIAVGVLACIVTLYWQGG